MLQKARLTIIATQLHKRLNMKNFKNYLLIGLLGSGLIFSGCSDDEEPEAENELEVITDVTVVFTDGAGNQVTASAKDPDGAGVQELALVDGGTINLAASTTYTLTFEILNALDPADVEDIGDEIAEEDDEHQIFFSFSTDAFSSPAGNGNIDTASDAVNYEDEDSDAQDGSGNPVGLETTWTTGADAVTGGTFQVKLQHQPDLKTATSTATTGDTDFDLTFVLNIQ